MTTDIRSLPPEVTHQYLQKLSADDLTAFCSTNEDATEYCRDSYFWEEKVRNTPRKTLQDDWLISLAKNGSLMILERLVIALLKEDALWKMDENVIVLALVYLAGRRADLLPPNQDMTTDKKERNSLFSRIEDALTSAVFPLGNDREEDGMRRNFYFVNKRWSAEQYHRELMEDLIAIEAHDRDADRPFYYRTISDCDVLRNYERQTILKYIKENLDVEFDDLPSASAYIAFCIVAEHPVFHLSTLEYFILPSLIENEDLDELKHYFRDVGSMQDILANKFADIDPEINMYDRTLRQICMEGTLSLITALFQSLHLNIDHTLNILFDQEKRFVVCHDPELYQMLSTLTNYADYILIGGYACMEPEEWLEWLNKTSLSKEKKRKTMNEIVNIALDNGYTYFTQIVNDA